MSAHRRHWIVAEQDRPRARALADALQLPPLVGHLLLLRGIESPDLAQAYLAPSLRALADPFTLTGMDAAVARIALARERGEHVRVFGDYDVDGIAATALMLKGLARFGVARTSYGMPNRFAEGYGLSPDHIDAAHAEGVSLLITVDNGVSAHDAARRAKDRGVDLIVTDHHSIEQGLPEAAAVINPRRESDNHPLAAISGAGVAFKLATALNGKPYDLDIVALGTVADIVPLRGENRVIVSLGLRHMAQHGRAGLAELAAAAGIDIRQACSENIAFQLGPRLNAAGRIDHGLPALELLLTDDAAQARALARALNDANDERRQIERRIFDEALEEIEATFHPAQRSIVLARRGWHPGVIGIVAARIEGRFRRPAIIIAITEDGLGRGSGRAGEDFDLVGALAGTREILVRYGGHRAAAGLTVEELQLDAFRAAFEAEARRQLGEDEPVRTLRIDALSMLSEIDAPLVRALERLEPVGCENPAPLFCTCGVEAVPGSVRLLKDQHVKLTVRQNGAERSAIAFNMADHFHTNAFAGTFDIAYAPQLNTWRGETSVQLVVKDIRPA